MKSVTAKDIYSYSYLENLVANPAKTLVAYQKAQADEESNSYKRQIWLIEDGKSKQLTSQDDRILLWEDDETLLFARNDKAVGKTNVYRIHVHGGEATVAFSLPFPVRSLHKFRKHYLALGEIDTDNANIYKEDDKKREEFYKQKQEQEKDWHEIDELPYWFNGSHYINKKRCGLFLVKKSGVTLISGDVDVSMIASDDKQVFVLGAQWQKKQPLTNALYAYDEKKEKLVPYYTKHDLSINHIFLWDHELYGLGSDMQTYGINETGAFIRFTKENAEVLDKPEISLYNSIAKDTSIGMGKECIVDEDVTFVATKDDRALLRTYRKDLSFEDLSFDKTNVFFFEKANDGIYFVGQTPETLEEVYFYRDGELSQLTKHNRDALKGKYVAKIERVDYSYQGENYHGWVLLPKNFDKKKKYPAILDVHGGPRAVYSDQFFHEMQVWASKGYFVFFTNINGSDGRGDAFADIRGKYGQIDFEVLMAFTDAVLEKYTSIDPQRVCETGGSYGGFMTNWIITHTDRFVACASQRSISNWVSFSLLSDIGWYFGPDQNGAKDVFDYETLWEHSPLKYATNVKTPTLFIHSDEDHRCPLEEGMQMMQALMVQNIDTKMVVFHGENHELSRSGRPKNRIKRLEAITSWFDRYTK